MTSSGPVYQPQRYWDDLLGEHLNERGVAYAYLPLTFNQAFYKAELDATRRLLADHAINPPARVLDIGSGTGIWIDFWRSFGASDVTGVDLTEASVANLRTRYPEHAFHRADVGAEALPVTGQFDVVSAMSVLLHITDDTRWRRALANIAHALVPGGYGILIEPLLTHPWWGPPFDSESNSKARPIEDYRQALTEAGLEVVEIRPATVLLANPIDTRSRPTFKSMWLYWAVIGRLIRGHERRGRVVGSLLGMVDAPLRRVMPSGPTAKLILVRRRQSTS